MEESRETEYLTAPLVATDTEHATTSSPPFFCALGESIVERKENGDHRSIEEQIEQSKSHWSQLSKPDSDFMDEEVAEISNVEVFKSLQTHSTWGTFFRTFGGGEDDMRELEMGKKFAEGGQAELHEAQVKWRFSDWLEYNLKHGYEWVLKVFKKGTFLQHLQSQWSQGLLQIHAERQENLRSSTCKLIRSYNCTVMICRTLLKDGRFAFLMEREHEDLLSLVNCMMSTTSHAHGPFSKGVAEEFMYHVAVGTDWLHGHNIVHRDLKASNVLFSTYGDIDRIHMACYVADFECSTGVVGTGFFMAPEILQACKDKFISQRLELFTNALDVYNYGMICYEIFNGKLPFEGHLTNDYDVVQKGQCL